MAEHTPTPWAPVWSPIRCLDLTKDDTYLVRVEDASGRGFIDKGYYADDDKFWASDDGKRIEIGPWKITAFAPWPRVEEIIVNHASDCATGNGPALPDGPCDCGAVRQVPAKVGA
jgi:hypothetical protein